MARRKIKHGDNDFFILDSSQITYQFHKAYNFDGIQYFICQNVLFLEEEYISDN